MVCSATLEVQRLLEGGAYWRKYGTHQSVRASASGLLRNVRTQAIIFFPHGWKVKVVYLHSTKDCHTLALGYHHSCFSQYIYFIMTESNQTTEISPLEKKIIRQVEVNEDI